MAGPLDTDDPWSRQPPPTSRGLARLHLLGGFQLRASDGCIATPRSAKGRAIIAYLALSPRGVGERGRLAGLVWGEGADAKASLRQCLRELRHTLSEAGLQTLLVTDPQHVALDLRQVWVDAIEMRKLARTGGHIDLDAIAALYTGHLFEGVEVRDPGFEEWLAGEREALRQQVCRALEAELERSSGERAGERTARAARTLLIVDPTHEAAHRALMRCHAMAGDVPAALRQYQACRDSLARGLDLEPSAETEALLRQIRGGQLTRAQPIPQRVVGPVIAARGPPHARVAVEERPAVSADATDIAIAAALASALREALARKRWLSVVDPEPQRLVGLGDPSPHLGGPDYKVSVALFRVADRMRFSAQLKDGPSARVLWAEHYDRPLGGEIFDVVDGLANSLARRLDRELELAEITRAVRKPLEELGAYDCLLRAIPLLFKLTPESFAEAERMLQAAQDADPHDSLVFAWKAFWYALSIGQGWVRNLGAARDELSYLVRRAIELDPKNGHALAVAGHIASFVNHDYEQALDLVKASLRLDPTSVYAWDFSAVTHCYTGNAKEALSQLDASEDFWQQHPAPFYVRTTACIASLLAGQHERAAALGRRMVKENPNFEAAYRPLIASLGLIGEVEEARTYLDRLRQLQPDFSIEWFRGNYPPLHEDDRVHYIEGLRKAGVCD